MGGNRPLSRGRPGRPAAEGCSSGASRISSRGKIWLSGAESGQARGTGEQARRDGPYAGYGQSSGDHWSENILLFQKY